MANTMRYGVVQSRHFGRQPVLEHMSRCVVLAPSDFYLFHQLKEFMKKTQIF